MTVPLQPLAHQYTKTTALPEMAPFAIPPDRENVHPIVRAQDRDLYFREHVDRLGVGSYAHVADADRCGHDPAAERGAGDAVRPGLHARHLRRVVVVGAGDRAGPAPAGRRGRVAASTASSRSPRTAPRSWASRPTSRASGWPRRSGSPMPAASARRWPNGWSTAARRRTSTSATSTGSRPTSWRPRTSTTAASRTTSRSTTSSIRSSRWRTRDRSGRRRSTSASRSSVRTSSRATAGSGRTGTASNEGLLGRYEIPRRNAWAERYWHPIAGAEALATRDTAGLYDMTSLKRLEVTGPGRAGLPRRAHDQPPGPGGRHGRVLAHARRARRHPQRPDDRAARRRTASRSARTATSTTTCCGVSPRRTAACRSATSPSGTCCIGLWGPRARDILASLTDSDVSNEAFRYFQGRELWVGNVPVTALRLSYVGELGWELYTTADMGTKLWDTLWAAGQAARPDRRRPERLRQPAPREGLSLVGRGHDDRARPVRGRPRVRGPHGQGRFRGARRAGRAERGERRQATRAR